MEDSKIAAFLNKTINKTKSKQLQWSKITSLLSIKDPLVNQKFLHHTLLTDSCFIAPFKNGELVFLTYVALNAFTSPAPPNECKFSLQLQEIHTSNSMEIVNSDSIYTSDLIRLYNLIDDSCQPLNILFNDFLNS